MAPRSSIWNYYIQNTKKENTVICRLCKVEVKTSGNTSNVKSHYINRHLKPKFENNETKRKAGRKFDIWKYFIKSTEKENIAICKLCTSEIKTSGNISNIKLHYFNRHKRIEHRKVKDKIVNINPEHVKTKSLGKEIKVEPELIIEDNSLLTDVVNSSIKLCTQEKRSSDIWQYFIKHKVKHNTAICKLCNVEVKTSGNTTNLKSHYLHNHREPKYKRNEMLHTYMNNIFKAQEEIVLLPADTHKLEMNPENIEEKILEHEIENSASQETNISENRDIWQYFIKSTTKYKTSTCIICNVEVKSSGNITNLKSHMYHHHKELQYKQGNTKEQLAETPSPKAAQELAVTTNSLPNIIEENNSTVKVQINDIIQKRKSSEKSDIWQHFIKNTTKYNTAICLLCNLEVKTSGNTTNLKSHYLHHHKNPKYKRRKFSNPFVKLEDVLSTEIPKIIATKIKSENTAENDILSPELRNSLTELSRPMQQHPMVTLATPELTKILPTIKPESQEQPTNETLPVESPFDLNEINDMPKPNTIPVHLNNISRNKLVETKSTQLRSKLNSFKYKNNAILRLNIRKSLQLQKTHDFHIKIQNKYLKKQTDLLEKQIKLQVEFMAKQTQWMEAQATKQEAFFQKQTAFITKQIYDYADKKS